jgi:hypothetical protein
MGVTTRLLAACNKNGVPDAWRKDALAQGPVWQRRINSVTSVPSCVGAPAFDGSSLLQTGGTTTIGGTSHQGSVRVLVPGPGAIRLAEPGKGGSAPGAYLLNARTGVVLKRLTSQATYAQPVFADGYLFTASVSQAASPPDVPSRARSESLSLHRFLGACGSASRSRWRRRRRRRRRTWPHRYGWFRRRDRPFE